LKRRFAVGRAASRAAPLPPANAAQWSFFERSSMYRHYGRGEAAWLDAIRRAKAFIAGPLYRHVTTWPRHGRLGVPEGIDGAALCTLPPPLLEEHGEFGLLSAADGDRLLVLPLHGPREVAVLCYGPWPGIEVWEAHLEPALPPGANLLGTRWNVMPRRAGTRLVPPAPAPRNRSSQGSVVTLTTALSDACPPSSTARAK
jgi:hypothetical protein